MKGLAAQRPSFSCWHWYSWCLPNWNCRLATSAGCRYHQEQIKQQQLMVLCVSRAYIQIINIWVDIVHIQYKHINIYTNIYVDLSLYAHMTYVSYVSIKHWLTLRPAILMSILTETTSILRVHHSHGWSRKKSAAVVGLVSAGPKRYEALPTQRGDEKMPRVAGPSLLSIIKRPGGFGYGYGF